MNHTMLLVLLGLLSLASSTTVPASSQMKVPSTYKPIGDYGFYEFVTTYEGSWASCQRRCEFYQAKLWIIRTTQERDDVIAYMKATGVPVTSSYWVGFNDISVEGMWVDVDGRYMDWEQNTMWGPNEPNGGNLENCAKITPSTVNLWDHSCSVSTKSVCKIEAWRTYTRYEGLGYYMVHQIPLSYEEAASKCRSQGASLAVVNSDVEAASINALFGEEVSTAFVGFKMTKEGLFRSTLGQSLDEAGWAKFDNTVFNAANDIQTCLELTADGLLRAVTCDVPKPFVCEHSL